jgi:hypothetical protein
MRAWRGLVACAGIALFGVSACGGGHSAPPDARVLGTRVDSPLPLDMDETSDGEAAGTADGVADGGVQGGGEPADGGPVTPDPGAAQARPTSTVTSPS